MQPDGHLVRTQQHVPAALQRRPIPLERIDMTKYADRIRISLLLLRLGVFLVITMWILDKFFNPGHAAAIFEKFYAIGGVGESIVIAIAVIEMVLLLLFVTGVKKTLTYGLVMLLHAGSTFSAFKQYLGPVRSSAVLRCLADAGRLCRAVHAARDRHLLHPRWQAGAS